MAIIRFNELPEGSGDLTSDDIFVFMDDPSGSGITKKITLSEISSLIGGGSGISSVSIVGGDYISSNLVGDTYTINAIGLQPSGDYSMVGHTHSASDITDFNSKVNELLPSISGSEYISTAFINNIYTISTSGLQPSGSYSETGHTHTSENITDFSSSVSGLLPVKNIIPGSGISVSSSNGDFTISSSGNFTTGSNIVVVQLGAVSGTIDTDASLGSIFNFTLAASGTLANPTNGVDGQTVRWRIVHGGNNLMLSLDTKFQVPSSASSPLPISSTSGSMDLLGATYDLSRDKWDIIAFVPGY